MWVLGIEVRGNTFAHYLYRTDMHLNTCFSLLQRHFRLLLPVFLLTLAACGKKTRLPNRKRP